MYTYPVVFGLVDSRREIQDWVQMGFNFAGNQYLVCSTATSYVLETSSRSFAVPKLITSVALQHAKLTVYTKKETCKGKD